MLKYVSIFVDGRIRVGEVVPGRMREAPEEMVYRMHVKREDLRLPREMYR